MLFRRPQRFVWIWLIIAAVFVGRADGAHLHLCFDGSEPPAAVHMQDGVDHDDAHHVETEHVDQDVDLFDAKLVKKASDGLDLLPGIAPSVLFVLPALAAPPERPAPVIAPLSRRLAFLAPPTRGPPF